MNWRLIAAGARFTMAVGAQAQESGIRLFAAGSPRAVMVEVIQAYGASGGPRVEATYGSSGLLRERIEKGEPAEILASADLGNAQALASAGRAAAPVIFVRNRLCAVVAPNVDVTSEVPLDRILDPRIKLGTSTPKADPSGDYAWQLFERADRLRPGTFAVLDAKALKLTGGPDSPPPPPDRSIYGVLIATGRADIFLTYCTNALQAVREVAGARMQTLPEPLTVGASYGLAVLNRASPAARSFALFLLSVPAQEILARHGFAPVGMP